MRAPCPRPAIEFSLLLLSCEAMEATNEEDDPHSVPPSSALLLRRNHVLQTGSQTSAWPSFCERRNSPKRDKRRPVFEEDPKDQPSNRVHRRKQLRNNRISSTTNRCSEPTHKRQKRCPPQQPRVRRRFVRLRFPAKDDDEEAQPARDRSEEFQRERDDEDRGRS